jgi:type IV pilus assembly protein PilF
MIKIHQLITVSIVSVLLCGCVTQNYENNEDSPVIENSSTNNEIASTRISLAMGYLDMGNTTQAKINLEKAKRFAPNLTRVYTAYAQYYSVVEEPEQAIQAFEKALSIDSNDADTLNNYGVFLCKQERYKESEQQMLKAIAVPTYALVSQSYENLSLCQLKAEKFDKAEMYLAKSISHSPGSSSALLQMLRLQYAMENYEQGQEYLRRYEKSTRRFTPNALALAYKLNQKQRNTRVANNYAGMLVKMFPNSYEAKQYIINGLKRIEADDLAKLYRSSGGKSQGKSKKRVMVLSPNKKSGISLTSKTKPMMKPSVAKTSEVALEKVTLNETTTSIESIKDELIEGPKEQKTLKDDLTTASSKIVDEIVEIDELDNQESLNVIQQEHDKKIKKISDGATTTVASNGQQMLTLPIHVVAKGDSLFSISKKYNIKMFHIERWNGFKRSQVLKIGNVIYLADPKKALKSQ